VIVCRGDGEFAIQRESRLFPFIVIIHGNRRNVVIAISHFPKCHDSYFALCDESESILPFIEWFILYLFLCFSDQFRCLILDVPFYGAFLTFQIIIAHICWVACQLNDETGARQERLENVYLKMFT